MYDEPTDDDRVSCAECGEAIPRIHTAYRSGIGRVCWFCYSEFEEDDDFDEGFSDEYSGEDSWDY